MFHVKHKTFIERMFMANSQTIYALSSGSLPSAIAVVRISGSLTKKTLVLLAGKVPKPRKLTLMELKSKNKEIIDVSLVCFFPKTESITGEDLVELHLHGSVAVLDEIYLFLASIKDLRPAEPGEFTRRSLINGKMGLTQVEGLADLIAAETKEQRIQSLRQLNGELSDKYLKWRKDLIETRAKIEALLDFSDEIDVNQNAEILSLERNIYNLIKNIDQDLIIGIAGERLRSGLKIALIGAPNVGKSSLINILLKEDRAIVSPQAGTTRDIIEARLNLEGVPVTIYDTAGIRKTKNEIEQEGVQRSQKTANTADIIVLIRSAEENIISDKIDSINSDGAKVIKVFNKIDLIKDKRSISLGGFAVSCKTKQGIESLLEALGKEAKKLTSFSDRAIGPNRIRHINHLRETKESLEMAIIELKVYKIEVAADFIRSASVSLGRIIGAVDIEDVLDELFLGFCIGK